MPRTVNRRASTAPGADRYRTEAEDDLDFDKDDDELEEPRRRREPAARRRAREEDLADAPAASDDDDDFESDDDDEFEATDRSSVLGKGFSSAKRQKAKGKGSGGIDKDDKVTLEENVPILVKFLEDDAFVTYGRHWVQAEKRTYTCLRDACPLCDIGEDPQERAAFNVVVVASDDPKADVPEGTAVLDLPPTAWGELEKYAADDKKGPLTKHYYEITQVKESSKGGKKGGFTSYKVALVKARDVEEDWEVDPLSEDEIDTARESLFTNEDHPYISALSYLEQAAKATAGADEDDEDDRRSSRRRGRR